MTWTPEKHALAKKYLEEGKRIGLNSLAFDLMGEMLAEIERLQKIEIKAAKCVLLHEQRAKDNSPFYAMEDLRFALYNPPAAEKGE